MRFRRIATIAAVGLALSALSAVVADAQAVQFKLGDIGGPGLDKNFSPSVNQRQFQRYADVLYLDEAQRIVAEQMLEEYLSQFRAGADRVRDGMDEIKEEVLATGDWTVYGERLTPLFEDWAAERERMENEFLETVRSLLTDDQLDRWVVFEREKRRGELLPNARLGGEDVDVTLLAGDLELSDDARASLAPLLEQYAIELDAALQSRERLIEPLQKEFWQSIGDPERASEIWDEATRKRIVVRDANRRYADLLAGQLGDAFASDVHRRFEELAYPLAYDETKADRMLAEARKLDLSPDQLEQMDAQEADFDMRIEALRRQIIRQIQEDELEPPEYVSNVVRSERGQTVAFTAVAGFGEDREDPMAELLRDRYMLSKSIVDRVEAILTPDQLDTMPRIPMSKDMNARFHKMQFRL